MAKILIRRRKTAARPTAARPTVRRCILCGIPARDFADGLYSLTSALRSAESWNASVRVGDAVTYTEDTGASVEAFTDSEAWTLGDGSSVVVRITGRRGAVDLNRVRLRRAARAWSASTYVRALLNWWAGRAKRLEEEAARAARRPVLVDTEDPLNARWTTLDELRRETGMDR
jgi:hypothetical protein